MPTYNVATFATGNLRGGVYINAYLRDYNPDWSECVMFSVEAATGREAKRYAVIMRKAYEVKRREGPSRYELLEDDTRFNLKKGDILICEPMHWAWAGEKVAVKCREADGYEPGCSQYRRTVRYVSGPRL